ncbi:MAG TPA: DoxX family protein [Haliangium sp.]|nr:DoxX family protein [Haliangium sp.]
MSTPKRVLLWLMAAFYVTAGVNHFVSPEFYLPMMPDYLPWHMALIYVSGVAELALGIAVLIPRLRVAAAWGIIALLVAVFPANLYAAMNQIPLIGAEPVWNWVRLPFQALFIAWAWWYTRSKNAPRLQDAPRVA